MLALLVGNRAACFAGRLARGLAFAAAAVFGSAIKVFFRKCFNVFHF